MIDVGERILEILKEKKMTKYKLAKNAGMSYSSVNTIIRRTKSPTIGTIKQICKGLGVSLGYFMKETDINEISKVGEVGYTKEPDMNFLYANENFNEKDDIYGENVKKNIFADSNDVYGDETICPGIFSEENICPESCLNKEKCYREFMYHFYEIIKSEMSKDIRK